MNVSAVRHRLIVLVAAGGLLSACGLNQEGVPPRKDSITFPASVVVDPAGKWLYVATSNSDLRYNDGTLLAVSVDNLERQRTKQWNDCPKVNYVRPYSDPDGDFCCWDRLDRNLLLCDERAMVLPDATVRIGSFAAGMVWQPLCPGSRLPADSRGACTPHGECNDPVHAADGRLFIGIRGNTSVTFVDVTHSADGLVRFDCGGSGTMPECDPAHRLTDTSTAVQGTEQSPVNLPDEPYALALDEPRQLLYAGHLKGDITRPGSGGVSLFDVAQHGEHARPVYLGPSPSPFPSDANGLFGVTSLMSHQLTPDSPAGEMFVTSRYLPRVAAIAPTQPSLGCTDAVTLTEIAIVGSSDGFDTTVAGTETRGVRFLSDPLNGTTQAFVLQRTPPALIAFNVGADAERRVRVTPSNVLETCSSPTFLDMHNPGGQGWELYVTCFETGQLYVFDPYVPRLKRVVDVGRGPAGLAFAPGPFDADGNDLHQSTRAYVVGFSESTIGVLDLDPASANDTQYHVVMRVGFPIPNTEPR